MTIARYGGRMRLVAGATKSLEHATSVSSAPTSDCVVRRATSWANIGAFTLTPGESAFKQSACTGSVLWHDRYTKRERRPRHAAALGVVVGQLNGSRRGRVLPAARPTRIPRNVALRGVRRRNGALERGGRIEEAI